MQEEFDEIKSHDQVAGYCASLPIRARDCERSKKKAAPAAGNAGAARRCAGTGSDRDQS
jgi:hypothetical protein